MAPLRWALLALSVGAASGQGQSAITGLAPGVNHQGKPPAGVFEQGIDVAGTRRLVQEADALLKELRPQKLLRTGDPGFLGRFSIADVLWDPQEQYPYLGVSQMAREMLLSAATWGSGGGVGDALHLLGMATLEGADERPPRFRNPMYRVVDALVLHRLWTELAPWEARMAAREVPEGYGKVDDMTFTAMFPRRPRSAAAYFAAGAGIGHAGCQHLLGVHYAYGLFGPGALPKPADVRVSRDSERRRQDPRELERVFKGGHRTDDRVVIKPGGRTATVMAVRNEKGQTEGLLRKVYDVDYDNNEKGRGLRHDQLIPLGKFLRRPGKEGATNEPKPKPKANKAAPPMDDPLLNTTLAENQDLLDIVKDSFEDPRAVLHERAAAAGGHLQAQMAMGYRYLYGVGVPASCERASAYYELAANAVVQWAKRRGNVFHPADTTRLSYITGRHGRASPAHLDGARLSHYTLEAQNGDMNAALTLGHIYYYGARGVQQDLTKAAEYYRRAAVYGNPHATAKFGLMQLEGAGIPQDEASARKNLEAAFRSGSEEAMEGLGRLYLKGSKAANIDANPATAKEYFEMAMEKGGIEAMLRLGLMHLELARVPQGSNTAEKAKIRTNHAKSSAPRPLQVSDAPHKGDKVEGNFRGQGRWYPAVIRTVRADGNFDLDYDDLDKEQRVPLSRLRWPAKETGGSPAPSPSAWSAQRHLQEATEYIRKAAANGNVQAMHTLGVLFTAGVGFAKNCESGVKYFKLVAERGPVAELLQRALARYSLGDLDGAVTNYLLAAEAGFEVAQLNAGELLDMGVCPYHAEAETPASLEAATLACERLAMKLYRRAAMQGNSEATLRLGDHAFRGSGDGRVDLKKAAAQYQRAAEEREAQALYNLGYMYQKGVGVPRDLHLAKRYYDIAAESDPDAIWPVLLALGSMLLDLLRDIWAGQGLESWRGVIFKTWLGEYPLEPLLAFTDALKDANPLHRTASFFYRSCAQLMDMILAKGDSSEHLHETAAQYNTAETLNAAGETAATDNGDGMPVWESLERAWVLLRGTISVILGKALPILAWDTFFLLVVSLSLACAIWLRNELARSRHLRLARARYQQAERRQQRQGAAAAGGAGRDA